LTGEPGWQPSKASHSSVPLQYCPSSHSVWTGKCTQESLAELQESAVQALASSQSSGSLPALAMISPVSLPRKRLPLKLRGRAR
jgi:hypothetical protein